MFLQYGSVTLSVIDLQRYERTAVYTPDGADLLYIKHTLGVTATYAPGGMPIMPSAAVISPDTAATLSGADATATVLKDTFRGAAPGATAIIVNPPTMALGLSGERLCSGPETDAELRNRLWQPRQRLTLWARERSSDNLIRWLESPRPGFCLDAANGPLPLGLDIVSVAGEPNAVGVYYTISTCLPPCATGSDRMVLSHRWQMSHTHDDDGFLTRVVDGDITFASSVLDLTGIDPNSVRNQFIHPIPLGFQRTVPLLALSQDGLVLKYQIKDTDPTCIFSPGDSHCTQISIKEDFLATIPYSGLAGPTRPLPPGIAPPQPTPYIPGSPDYGFGPF